MTETPPHVEQCAPSLLSMPPGKAVSGRTLHAGRDPSHSCVQGSYSWPCDAWSAGVMIYIMLSVRPLNAAMQPLEDRRAATLYAWLRGRDWVCRPGGEEGHPALP